jgi:hypothetical protein
VRKRSCDIITNISSFSNEAWKRIFNDGKRKMIGRKDNIASPALC